MAFLFLIGDSMQQPKIMARSLQTIRQRLFVALLLAIVVSACGRKEETELADPGVASETEQTQATVLRAAYIPLTANLPLFVALEERYFEECGVQVEAIEATSPNDIMNGIIAGHVDFAAVMAYPIVFSAHLRAPGAFKIAGGAEETLSNFTSSIVTLQDSPLSSIEEVIGKRVGVYGGIVQVSFLKAILVGMGFESDAVSIVEISPRLQIQGLVSEQYEALSTTEPTSTIAQAQGISRVLAENPRVKFIMNPFPSTAATLSTDLIERDPQSVECVTGSLDRAIDLIENERDRAVSHLTKYTPIPEDVEEEVLRDLRLFHYVRSYEVSSEPIQQFADFLFENEILPAQIPDVTDFMIARPEPESQPD